VTLLCFEPILRLRFLKRLLSQVGKQWLLQIIDVFLLRGEHRVRLLALIYKLHGVTTDVLKFDRALFEAKTVFGFLLKLALIKLSNKVLFDAVYLRGIIIQG